MAEKNRSIQGQNPHGMSEKRKNALVLSALGIIILLGATLRFYELGAASIGNTYYAATVKSMLTSWDNFFFAAFEPGGSVSVDKPPVGFWVQAASAYFLGVNGFALALPQALAGVLAIPLMYHLVRKYFGVGAGLVSALVLALMPITIATERNNTIDGQLVFVLLLSTWMFLKAVETGKLGHLLAGAALVGLGFNIKMLQAYMVLPALYAMYFFGSRIPWLKRMLYLSLATLLLAGISFSWAIAVDLTPAEARPYVGSSEDNSVLELIIGHNGLKRLNKITGGMRRADASKSGPAPIDQTPSSHAPQGQNQLPSGNDPQRIDQQDLRQPPPEAVQACEGLSEESTCTVELPKGDIRGSCLSNHVGILVCVPEFNSNTPGIPPQPPQGTSGTPGNQPAGGPGRSGNLNDSETGEAGVPRLFEEPLVTEASWMLPMVLLALPVVMITIGWKYPLDGKQISLILWAGWLLPVMAYFSFTNGLFHRYYLIMLGPPLAALTGISFWSFHTVFQKNRTSGWLTAGLISGLSMLFEISVMWSYREYAVPAAGAAFGLWLGGMALLTIGKRRWLHLVGMACLLGSMLAAPFTWSLLTTLNTDPNVGLPTAGPAQSDQTKATQMTPNLSTLSTNGEAILEHVLANTDPDDYLLATLNARGAAPYILETGRPVLTFGGFSGNDDVVLVEDLSEMAADGELRYILGMPQQKPDIAIWVAENCTIVDVPGVVEKRQAPKFDGQGEDVLFDCGEG